jgi:hypothetical protein
MPKNPESDREQSVPDPAKRVVNSSESHVFVPIGARPREDRGDDTRTEIMATSRRTREGVVGFLDPNTNDNDFKGRIERYLLGPYLRDFNIKVREQGKMNGWEIHYAVMRHLQWLFLSGSNTLDPANATPDQLKEHFRKGVIGILGWGTMAKHDISKALISCVKSDDGPRLLGADISEIAIDHGSDQMVNELGVPSAKMHALQADFTGTFAPDMFSETMRRINLDQKPEDILAALQENVRITWENFVQKGIHPNSQYAQKIVVPPEWRPNIFFLNMVATDLERAYQLRKYIKKKVGNKKEREKLHRRHDELIQAINVLATRLMVHQAFSLMMPLSAENKTKHEVVVFIDIKKLAYEIPENAPGLPLADIFNDNYTPYFSAKTFPDVPDMLGALNKISLSDGSMVRCELVQAPAQDVESRSGLNRKKMQDTWKWPDEHDHFHEVVCLRFFIVEPSDPNIKPIS